MSSNRRPWYKWWPKDFTSDEKVKCLPPLAELIYRRALDLMWESNDTRIPNAIDLLCESLGKGIPVASFSHEWERIMYPDFELFKVSDDGKWLYSPRLKSQADEIKDKSEKRKSAGKKGASSRWKKKKKEEPKQTYGKSIANGMANDRQLPTDTDTDSDSKELTLKGTYVPPSKDEIENESAVKLKKDLQAATKEIYDKKIFPKVVAWVNTMRKAGKNDRAILHTLLRCIMKPPKESCWAYCTRIISIEDGNFNERDYQKTA